MSGTTTPLLYGVRLAKRASRLTLPTFRTAARAASHGSALSTAAAVAAARRALARVPAYADFVAQHGGVPTAASPAEWLAALPITDKHNYVDRYRLAARCRGGEIPAVGVELDESAGSSGRPYTWARSDAELHEVHTTLAMLARHLLSTEPLHLAPVITLNGFSMGAWATGSNVPRALGRLGAVKSTGPEPEKILSTLELLGTSYTWLITGYPPFLRTLLDAAEQRGLDLSSYRLYGFVGGEGMSETLRRRLERRFRAVYSAYGASDLDIGVAAELPASVWLRQQAAANPRLAEALFGTRARLPMVFQYDPTDYHVETIGGELVVTVCRPAVLSPRVRYNIHDAGGSLSYRHVVAVCRDFGLDLERDSQARAAIPVLRLPFLYVHGRSDSTVSVHGANIYPEDVEWGLGEAPDADLVLGYALDIEEDTDGFVRPLVHVETAHPAPDGLAERLAQAVRQRLLANSADVRAAAAENPHVTRVVVRLHPPGTGPFVTDARRIKRRYVVTGDQS
jgi:phenylacetate-CoA ligase